MKAVASLAVLLLTACAPTVNVSQFSASRTPTAHVDVFTDRANVGRPFREIGLIVVDDKESGAWGMSDETSLIGKAKAKAMTLGANAIILLPSELQQRNIGYGLAHNSVNRRFVRASAIVYSGR
jgi:hypothetical protein